MTRRWVIGGFLMVAAAAAGGFAWWRSHHVDAPQDLRLYGSIDLRQVALAFNGSERIAEVLVEEGARVRKGEVLARLDTGRLDPQVAGRGSGGGAARRGGAAAQRQSPRGDRPGRRQFRPGQGRRRQRPPP